MFGQREALGDSCPLGAVLGQGVRCQALLLQVAAGLGCARGRDREAAPSATQAAGEEGIWVFGVN